MAHWTLRPTVAPLRRRTLWLLTVAVAIAGCGGSSPTAPSRSIAGYWTGTTSDATGTGAFTASLSQNGSNVSGSWTDTFRVGATSVTETGSLTGSFDGEHLSFTLSGAGTLAGITCGVQSTGKLALTGTALQGSYSATNTCESGQFIGTMSIQQ